MFRYFSYLALAGSVLGFVPSGLAQKKPKENAQVLVGIKFAAIDATAVIRFHLYGPNEVFDFYSNGPGPGIVYIDTVNFLMTPGKNYLLNMNCPNWRRGVGKISAPPGYTVYVDNRPIPTLSCADNQVDSYTNIVLRPNDVSTQLPAGMAIAPQVGEVIWSISAGTYSNGLPAGSIQWRARALSVDLLDPGALIYTEPGSPEILVSRASDGSLLKVDSPQFILYVRRNSTPGTGYTIEIYDPTATPNSAGDGYDILPYRKFIVSNPNGSWQNEIKLEKQELSGGFDSKSWDLSQTSSGWSIIETEGLRTTQLISTNDGSGRRVETATVEDSAHVVATKVIRTYLNFPAWGQEELVEEIADPDGLGLRTRYEYHTSGAASLGRLKSIQRPDGSWESYQYDEGTYNWGDLTAVYRPWQDLPTGPSEAGPSSGQVALFSYTGWGSLSGGANVFSDLLLTGSETRVLGTTVSKSITGYATPADAPNGQPLQVVTTQSYPGNGAPPLISSRTSYRDTAAENYRFRLFAETHADGTKLSVLRFKGNWINYWKPNNLPEASSFKKTPGSPSADTTWGEYQFSGFSLPVKDSVPVNSWDGEAFDTVYMVPNRSSVALNLFNAQGQIWSRIQAIFTGSAGGVPSFEFISLHETGYLNGIATIQSGMSGERDELALIRGQVTNHLLNDGSSVGYLRDSLGRDTTDVSSSMDPASDYAAQGAVYIHKSFDAAGRILTEKVSPSADAAANPAEAVTTKRQFNLAGLLTEEIAEYGAAHLKTTYAYLNNGRTVSVTLPGGATRITDTYLDGSLKSITGSAQTASYTTVGVNSDGTLTTRTTLGSSTSSRWTQSTTDSLGRTVKTESPAFGGGTNIIQTRYDPSTGKLTGTSQTDGTGNKLVADTLVEYNAWQQPYRTGLHLGSGDKLDVASKDRITETDAFFEKDGSGTWWSKTTTKVYQLDNNTTPLTVSSVRSRLNKFDDSGRHFGNYVQSETVATDVFGNETRNTVEVQRGTSYFQTDLRLVTSTTYYSGSSVPEISVARNGLLQKRQTKEGLVSRSYYDSRGRLVKQTNPRIDPSTAPRRGYVTNSDRTAWTQDSAGNQTTYAYYPDTGRSYAVTNPLGKAAYTSYNSRGQVEHAWGPATYPVEYSFNAYGEQDSMKTFRDPSVDWSGGAWPGNAGTGDQTTWNRDPATGLLLSKVDAQNHTVTYSYTARGQLQTRTWARGVGTTYGYDGNTGEETSVSYSDGTPTLSYSFDRRGLMASVNDFTGTRNVSHSDDGKVAAEYLADFYQNRELHSTLDTTPGTRGRIAAMSVGSGGNPANEYTINYGYDGNGRLNAVAGFTYHFVPNSNLIANVVEGASGTTQYRTYESNRDLRASVDTIFGGTSVARFAYGHDELGRRISNTQSGAVFSSYQGQGLQTSWGYNDRSEVVNSQTTFLGTGAAVGGRSYQYAYDNIGNRTSSQVDGATTSYTANELNQYTQRAVPGQVLATGFAPESATVTDNGQPTNRQGEYYYLMRAFDNGGASWQTDNIVSSLGGSITLSSFLPANPESYTYDLDGNLLTDGRWQYTWDAENRLTSMETSGAAFGVGVPSQRLEFQYDYLGRRVLKRTLSWSNLVSERRFLYDGWNLLEEFDTTSGFSLVAQHVWGIDLGGGLQNAGGVGGLLLTTTVDGGSRVNLIPAFDGNGNVHAMIDAASGSLRAKFEYNAFGETLRASGDLASKVPFRFSTKYTDQESQFLYYGFRYYNPNLGRFLGRDPMEEAGGLHLYAFCGNNGVNRWDVLGMDPVTEFSGLADPSWTPIGTNLNMWVAPDHKVYHWIDPDLALLDSNDPYWDEHANDSHSNNYEEYAASVNAQQDKMSAQNEAFFEDFDRRALQDPAPNPVAKTAVSPPSVVAQNSGGLLSSIGSWLTTPVHTGSPGLDNVLGVLNPNNWAMAVGSAFLDITHAFNRVIDESVSRAVDAFGGSPSDAQIIGFGAKAVATELMGAGIFGKAQTVAAAESAVPRTIGEILPGAHPDTMIHLTPFEEGSFVNGVDHGTYFARLKDVSSMTIEQYQADVVGRAAAAAPGQPVSAFITSAPGSGTFLEAGVFNNAGVMEHTNSGLLTSFKYVPIW